MNAHTVGVNLARARYKKHFMHFAIITGTMVKKINAELQYAGYILPLQLLSLPTKICKLY